MSAITSSDLSNKMSASKTTTKKTTKVEAVVAAVVAPAVVAAATAAPVAAVKAPKAAKAAKATDAAATTVATAATATTATTATTTPDAAHTVTVDATMDAAAPVVAADEDVGSALTKSITELHEQLSNLKSAFSTALTTLKTIEKQSARVVKKAERRRKRKVEAGAEGAKPCIFTKPVRITDELSTFLALPKGQEVSRSEVTKGVMAYARAHNLMDKQTIKADATLRKLLTLSETDSLTILNLQKFLRRHYVKPTPVAA
jgi:chromatin remodeling complex protein RSC6